MNHDPRMETAVAFAKRVGTYGKIDRSEQYEGELDSLNGVLLRRKLQNKYDELFRNLRRIENLHLRNAILITVTSAILSRAPEIVAFLARKL